MTDSPLRPVRLDLSGERLLATYDVHGSTERTTSVLDQLVVEQTIEFPADLVPDDDIKRHIIGTVEQLDRLDNDRSRAVVSYAVELAGGQLPQLFNVLFGNISLVPGVRLVDVQLPATLLEAFPGPRHGVPGLRQRFLPDGGPLLATALKPMGTPVDDLAAMAYDLAAGGINLVKDDHSFGNQPFSTFRDRVPAIADAVRRANDDRSEPSSIYLPALNLRAEDLDAGVELAVEAGVGGLLLLPGLISHDRMRAITDSLPEDLVVMTHPSFLGQLVTDPTAGFAHGLLLGTFARLCGADVTVFPNHGGRFSFTPETCTEVASACLAELGDLATCWPAPGGGMSLERVGEMLRFYGEDVCLLIGGELYRGDILTRTRQMVETIQEVRT
ncbi:MAG: ribulose 1,5-bisphosphate carboxylase large subunit [Nitriliruptor sp.]|nr:MAG: ribulose 1,5-bisphosphate carboxylase large subunit [Nitriliruptor sp.]